MSRLVAWWEHDRAAAHHPLEHRRSAEDDKTVERAMRLISKGEIGRAVRLLHGNGLADLQDDRIVDQLRRKHPPRKAEVQPTLAQLGNFRRMQVDLGNVFRELDVHAGTGVSTCGLGSTIAVSP